MPMIQCVPHGSTNSTLFSVGRIRASSESMRSRGTTMWTPFDGRTGSGDVDAGEALHLRRPDAGRIDGHAGADVELRVALLVACADAGQRRAVVEELRHLDGRDAARALRGGGAGERHREAGVIDLRVVA